MVTEIVNAVLSDNTNRRITVVNLEEEKKKKKQAKTTQAKPNTKHVKANAQQKKIAGQTRNEGAKLIPDDSIIGQPCPACGKGHIIKGNAAYGCSEWKSGCIFRLPFAVKS